jgi:protein SCO1/2
MKPRLASAAPDSMRLSRRALIFVALLLAALCLAACGGTPLPVLGQIPEFHLTTQNGQPFDSQKLSGKVWVADFIYTSCPGPCPMMSSRMRQIQSATAGLPDVRLVSFTVDPAHDTPAVLAEYAKHFLAQAGRWYFLTGDQAKLDALGFKAFHLNRVDGNFDHSTRFTLIDRQGRIRGYYAFNDDDFPKRLIADVRSLDRSRS